MLGWGSGMGSGENVEEKFFVICFRPQPALICAGLNLCSSVIKRHDEYVFFMN